LYWPVQEKPICKSNGKKGSNRLLNGSFLQKNNVKEKDEKFAL
jgi:hypothetical protein